MMRGPGARLSAAIAASAASVLAAKSAGIPTRSAAAAIAAAGSVRSW